MADFTASAPSYGFAGGRSVIAVLGPTNTGKTHLAIERMLGHESGLIGLPLRLLAREVYDKIVARIGPARVALITGEERIIPENPRYYVSTVEAMPRDLDVEFVAVDEIQLAADPERGHVFTERLFSARGRSETLLLGAQTMQQSINDLLPGTNFITRHRFSKLTYAGQKKITRLPRRSAIVTFSAADVYAIAELVRRQRGGAAVVLGALSPRTRNAQVELYQSGDVDFLVATDAIGMGLNLDVDHVAFAATRKFDGRNHRELSPGELSQIAGRAGRHLNDGTFGVTGDVEPFESDVVNRLENHEFEPVKILQWRNGNLDFASLDRLKESLRQVPPSPRLTRARSADDVLALDYLSEDSEIRDMARAPAALRMLWDVCQVPDYRKISATNHSELVSTLYKYLVSDAGVIPEDWFASQVNLADRTDGDIDTLSNRIAHIRTWTYVSNRQSWLADTEHWRQRTREIEDTLSDALHELLTQRFVDRRTSVLMKSMRDKDTLYADIENTGQIYVEKHYVGKLAGFRFTPDAAASGIHGKAARHAAAKVLASELAMRAERLGDAKDDAFQLSRTGKILWEKQEIGILEAGDDPLRPVFSLTADEHLSQPDRDRILKRVQGWMNNLIETRLKPLIDLARSQEIAGLARGIAFRLVENFGILPRETVANELRALDQQARAELRKYGVRFGAYNIYFPLLLKPAAADLLLLLWALKHGGAAGLNTADLPEPPRQGLTSVPVDVAYPPAFYRAAGFQICGPRAVRIDMLERLADLIRPLSSWKPTEASPNPPAGAVGRGGFKVQPEMMSIMGCSADELGHVLFSLGFRKERRPIQAKPAETADAAAAAQDAAQPGESAPAGDFPETIAAEAMSEATVASEEEVTEQPAKTVEAVAPETEAEHDAVIAMASEDRADAAASDSGETAAAAAAELEADAASQAAIASEDSAPITAAEAGADAAAEAPAVEASTDAAAEAPAAEASADAGAQVAAAEEEPQFEEIWRPRRRGQEDGRPAQRRDRRPERQGQPGQQRDCGPRHGHGQGQGRGQAQGQGQEQGQGDRAPAAAASGDKPGQPQQQRGEHRQDRRRDGDRRDERRRDDRPRENRPQEGRGREDRRRDEHRKGGGGRPQHSGAPRVQSASPRPQKGAASNADSPFAALMQLKEQLERRTQDQA
jgi:ATP-dependent RNA helicase SUPV3L1/SUV3